jgi:hypothetical protein
MNQKVKLKYRARDWAKEFHLNMKRYNVLVNHRRSGKTVASLMQLLMSAVKTPNGRFAYIAPYYKQSKNVSWDILKSITKDIPGAKLNISELKVDFHNGARIQLLGADNPDSLRGIKLHGVVFDEYSQQPASIFTEVVRPMLTDTKGYAIWIGTPQGMNDFFRLYDTHKNDEEWYVRLLRASESNIIEPEELEDAKKTMSEDEYNQEFECSFTAAIKGAYYAKELHKCRAEGRVTKVPYQPDTPVYTFWDLGMSDSTTIVFAQFANQEIHIIDCYSNNGYGLEHYAKICKQKNYIYHSHYFPFDIKVKELGTGKSRYEIVKELFGDEKIEVCKQIGLKDGIDAVRNIFNRCWFDEKNTEKLVDALSQYTQEWDDKKGMFKPKPLHNWASHFADSFRYLAVSMYNVLKPTTQSYEKAAEEFISHKSYVKKFDPELGLKKEDWQEYEKEARQFLAQ